MRVTLYPISMSCLVAGNRTTKIDGWGYSGPAFSRVSLFSSPFFFSRFLAVLGQFERDDVGGGVRKGTADAISWSAAGTSR